MLIEVNVPKNINRIKSKIIFNLTKRQLICFSLAGIVAFPVYFMTRNIIGNDMATLLMTFIAMPFFVFALYSKNGFPAEAMLYYMFRQKVMTKQVRKNKSENKYLVLEEQEKLRKEIEELENRIKEIGQKKTSAISSNHKAEKRNTKKEKHSKQDSASVQISPDSTGNHKLSEDVS